MNKDIFVDVFTATFVLGSVFGIEPIKKALLRMKRLVMRERFSSKVSGGCAHSH